jgi:major membrane immunogen (membrane-anchored lipoprotein)
MSKSIRVVISTAVLLSACSSGESETYTLYRNSVLDGGLRIHMATFDAKDGEAYNRENCQIAMDLFQKQPGVTVRYWCEKGKFRT